MCMSYLIEILSLLLCLCLRFAFSDTIFLLIIGSGSFFYYCVCPLKREIYLLLKCPGKVKRERKRWNSVFDCTLYQCRVQMEYQEKQSEKKHNRLGKKELSHDEK